MATKKRVSPRRHRKPEVVLPPEAARRTRFVKATDGTPTPDQVEQLVRQRTAERLSGKLLEATLHGPVVGYHHEVTDLDGYVAKAIIRALLPWVRSRLIEQDGPEQDRQLAWVKRAEDFVR